MSQKEQLSTEEGASSKVHTKEERKAIGRVKRTGGRMKSQGSRGTLSLDQRESTLVESEGNPRELLNSRVAELEEQLKEMEARHSALVNETRLARKLFEGEQEEFDDIISVAKRNVKGVVREVLDHQAEERELSRLLETEGAEVKREEEERTRRIAREEDRVTRNIVLLQTKLLILEEKRFERNNLLAKISQAEKKIVDKDVYYEENIEKARQKMGTKYEKLYTVLADQMRAVSEDAGSVGRTQQVSALKERQLCILETQARYKRVAQLMVRLRDQNSVMRRKMQALQKEMDVCTSLANSLSDEALKAKEDLVSFVDQQQVDEISEKDSSRDLLAEFKSLIHELETRLRGRNDYREELKEILADQETYKKILDKEEISRSGTQEKIFNVSQVAELVLGKGDLVEDPKLETLSDDRSTFLTKMSTILLETTEKPKKLDELVYEDSTMDGEGTGMSYAKGVLGLVPEYSSRSQSKPHTPQE